MSLSFFPKQKEKRVRKVESFSLAKTLPWKSGKIIKVPYHKGHFIQKEPLFRSWLFVCFLRKRWHWRLCDNKQYATQFRLYFFHYWRCPEKKGGSDMVPFCFLLLSFLCLFLFSSQLICLTKLIMPFSFLFFLKSF